MPKPYVKIEIGSDGRHVLIEPPRRQGLDRRVFRELPGGYEWAHHSDWLACGPRARWYGWSSKELPDTMRATGR